MTTPKRLRSQVKRHGSLEQKPSPSSPKPPGARQTTIEIENLSHLAFNNEPISTAKLQSDLMSVFRDHASLVPSKAPSIISTITPRMCHRPVKSTLASLPADLILYLSQFTDFNSLLALRSTCKSLHSLLSAPHLHLIRSKIISTYLADESRQLQAYRDSHPPSPRGHLWDLFYAAFEWQLLERPAKDLICYGCLETKPLHEFVERMSSRGTGLGGRQARERRCKDCMRRYRNIGGEWWREHWVRKADTVRRRGPFERWTRWATKGDTLQRVQRGEEIGVCAECGTGQFELWWGCVGCFEKEELRRRREEWSRLGLDIEQAEEVDPWLQWLLERGEQWRGRRERRRRKRCARQAEGRGKWWRRMLSWGRVSWQGSWGERVEALVEYLNGTHNGRDDVPIIRDTRPPKTTSQALEEQAMWKPTDVMPLKKDRREARCSMCWVPTCRRKTYMLGLAYERKLSIDRWCVDCQDEHRQKQERRLRKKGVQDSERVDAEEAMRGMPRLFLEA